MFLTRKKVGCFMKKLFTATRSPSDPDRYVLVDWLKIQ